MKTVERLPRYFVAEHHEEYIRQLENDFPDILNREYITNMLGVICKCSGIYRNYRVSLDGMLDAQINSVTIIKNLLPFLYCHCLKNIQGQDKWKALQKAYVMLIDILKYLKENTESFLNQGLEEATNLTIYTQGQSGGSLKEVKKFLERKYSIPLKKGRKATRLPIARQALAMKNQNPRMSWMQITNKLCRCGKPIHDYNCKENIRRGVSDLKKMLKLSKQ